MNAPVKPEKPVLPPLPTGKTPDAREMHDRVMKRFPKTMARLAE